MARDRYDNISEVKTCMRSPVILISRLGEIVNAYATSLTWVVGPSSDLREATVIALRFRFAPQKIRKSRVLESAVASVFRFLSCINSVGCVDG